jgi:hypothetical protein
MSPVPQSGSTLIREPTFMTEAASNMTLESDRSSLVLRFAPGQDLYEQLTGWAVFARGLRSHGAFGAPGCGPLTLPISKLFFISSSIFF